MNPNEQGDINAQNQQVPINQNPPVPPQPPVGLPQVPPINNDQNINVEGPAVNPDLNVQNQPLANPQPNPIDNSAPAGIQNNVQPAPAPQPPFPPTQPQAMPGAFNSSLAAPIQSPVATTSQQTPIMSGNSLSMNGSGSSKKKWIMIAVIIAAVAAVIGSGIFIYMKYMGGIKLVNYSDSEFSIDRPEDYEKEEVYASIVFKEPGESDDDKTRSGILVSVIGSPMEITDEIREANLQAIEDDIGDLMGGMLESNQKFENSSTEKIDFEGYDAIKGRTDVYEDGNKAGTVYILSGATKDTYFTVLVSAHTSDPGFEKKADEIINSFKLN